MLLPPLVLVGGLLVLVAAAVLGVLLTDPLALTRLPGSTRRTPARPVMGDAPAEIDVGSCDSALIDQDGAFVLTDECGLRVDLLSRDRILRLQCLVAAEIDAGVREEGLIALKRPFCLGQHRAVRRGIYLSEELARLNVGSFSEIDAEKLAAYLGEDGNARPGLSSPKGGYRDRNVLAHHLGLGDRYGRNWRRLDGSVMENNPCDQGYGQQAQSGEDP
jgi:hypothetical protein